MAVRATIVRPPVDVLYKFSKPVECLALGYLAAAVRAIGHEAVLLDGMLYDWSVEYTAQRILETRPDVVGFTSVLNHFPVQHEQISALLRAGGFGGPILVGGHAVSFFPDRVLDAAPSVDAVVCGEGEVPFQLIVEAVAAGREWTRVPGLAVRDGGRVRRTGVRRLTDLDLLAHPARDLTDEVVDRDGLAALSTSRGCYARCNFCSIPRFYGLENGGKGLASGDWLGRSPESVVAEVLDLHELTGLLELLFVDDEFFGGTEEGRARAIEIGDRLAAAGSETGFAISLRAENAIPEVLERLKAGGLRHCFIGLESGLDEDLKLYGKGHTARQNRSAVEAVRGLGLSFQPGFMMFNFDSTIPQLRRNLEFLAEIDECKPITINSMVDPHFGTPLLRVMRRADVLEDEGGPTMGVRFKDPKTGYAKAIAQTVADAYTPFMATIAAMQAAITFEWRRPVLGRPVEVQRVIDEFEDCANQAFVEVVSDTLGQLDANPVERAADLVAEGAERVQGVVASLGLKRSLLLLYLSRRDSGVMFQTQRALINAHQARALDDAALPVG